LSVIARRQFEEAGVAVIELPMLYTAEFERAQLQTLADVLEDLAQVDDQKENVVPSKNVRRR